MLRKLRTLYWNDLKRRNDADMSASEPTLRLEEKAAAPSTDIDEPTRAMLRMLSEEPMARKSNMARFAPKRAVDMALMEDPSLPRLRSDSDEPK